MVPSLVSFAVLGAGAWGTALSLHLTQRGDSARLWTWQPEHAEQLRKERENSAYLPGFPLPSNVEASSDIVEVVRGATLVLVVVPSPSVRSVLEAALPSLAPEAIVVIASKGIETGSLMLMSEVALDVLGAERGASVVALSGPSFALEVARGIPTNLVAAGIDPQTTRFAQHTLAGERLRIYSSDDVVGVEVGGALKNVIAIAAGASDGLGFGHNTRAALITRGLSEMARLAVAKGGRPLTLSGLSGMGDLVLTCTAELSRNRTVGFELGRGKRLEDVLKNLGHVAEGVTTTHSAYHLASQLGVELPIVTQVYRVLYEGKPVGEAVRDLLNRPLGRE